MYAIVKTGGKQYKVNPGDILSVEKLDAAEGDTVELPVITVVDGDKAEFDPEKAAATKVTAEVLEQYRGKKQLVFKFKRRKNYKKMRGHRQSLTRLRILSVGSDKYVAPKKEAAPAKKAQEAAPAEDVDIKDAAEELANSEAE